MIESDFLGPKIDRFSDEIIAYLVVIPSDPMIGSAYSEYASLLSSIISILLSVVNEQSFYHQSQRLVIFLPIAGYL